MSKGLPRSLGRANPQLAPIMKQRIDVSDVAIAVADGAPGFGTVVIGDLPQGNVLFLGATAYLQFSTDDADVTAAFDGDFAIGTVATVDGNVSDPGEADVIPSTALGAATAKVSPRVRAVSTDAIGGGVIDNTDGSLELNLNLLIDDAAISGAASFTVNGVVWVLYSVLGDD